MGGDTKTQSTFSLALRSDHAKTVLHNTDWNLAKSGDEIKNDLDFQHNESKNFVLNKTRVK